MATDRTVRRLRLTAPGEDEVRRMLPRLEDALRCATLPDGDARVLLVRRLVLGRLDRDASAQALARIIENRVRAAPLQWVAGGSAAADAADFVCFDSALDARVKLALRLVRGEPCTGWYWPLAVKEFHAQRGAEDNVGAMAYVIAQWPEARVAFPAWIAALVREGAVAVLAAAIGEKEGRLLLQVAGIDAPAPGQPAGGDPAPGAAAPGAAGPHPASARQRAAAGQAPSSPRSWLLDVLKAAGVMPAAPSVTVALSRQLAQRVAREAQAQPGAPQPRQPTPPAEDPPQPLRDGAQPGMPRSAAPQSPPPRMPAHDPAAAADVPQVLQEALTEQLDSPAALPPLPFAALEQPVYLLPTAAGGLLFLLPVLQRLGLPEWLMAADPDHAGFAPRILAAALRRLRVPHDDPAWLLATPPPWLTARGSGPAGPIASSLELPWDSAVLAPPHAARVAPELRALLRTADTADEQAGLWLTAARRWLRRAGHIGLASLVCRPARVSVAPTHADVHFGLADADIRVRRLGLDADPGWLPWFGRVVGFHFREPSP